MENIEWRPLSFVGLDNYSVSNTGQVRNDKTGRILKQHLHKKYYKVNIRSIDCRIHRLVAIAFIPNPYNLPEVNHKDEDTTNNNVDNLEWCSRLYNIEYSKINNPVDCYSKDGEYIKTYWSISEAGRECNINSKCISNCCNGKQNYSGGYRWTYSGCELHELIPKKQRPKKEKPVKQPRIKLTEEEKQDRKRKYYQKNRDRILAKNAEWKANNRDRCLKKKREYNALHSEERKAYNKQYRERLRVI